MSNPFIIPPNLRLILCGKRNLFLLANVAIGLIVLISTEALSFFRLFSFGPVLAVWVFFVFLACGKLVLSPKSGGTERKEIPPSEPLDFFERAFLIGMGVVLIVLGLTAFLTPPNNWDAMTYHMGRVAHWVQNKSVDYYPTSIIRQLSFSPFGEYVLAHARILAGTDRYVNLVSWFYSLGTLAGISLIAKILGASRKIQILTAVISLTIPMALLQATTSQNIAVMTFWLVCGIYYLLLAGQNRSFFLILLAGVCLGLAILTKGVAAIFAAPFVIWYLLDCFGKDRKRVVSGLIAILALILVTQSPVLIRNKAMFSGQDKSDAMEYRALFNQRFDGRVLCSNLVKNLALHLYTPSHTLNQFIEKSILQTDRLLGTTPSHSSFAGHEFKFNGLPFHEDHAGNLLHVLLFGLAMGLYFGKGFFRDKKLTAYLICVLGGIFLFSFILKWQPWHSRMHLPLFILAAPFIALTSWRALPKATAFFAAGLFLCSLPWVFMNASHPIFGQSNILTDPREQQYFVNNPGYYYSYRKAAEQLSKGTCRDVGLVMGGDSWEYPLWALLDNMGGKFRMEHVLVNNPSAALSRRKPFSEFHACALVSDRPDPGPRIVLDGKDFMLARKLTFLSVYQKDPDGTLAVRSAWYHFQQSMRNFPFILAITRKLNTPDSLNDQEMSRAVDAYLRYLQAVRAVDTRALNKFYPGLGEHFQQDFLTGMEQTMEGCRNQDKNLLIQGRQKLEQWRQWLNEKSSEIDSIRGHGL